MKLFVMDDYETWIGSDLESCKAAYIKLYGDDACTREAIDDAHEINDASLDLIKVDLSINADGSGPILTAREFLAQEIAEGGEFPRYAYGDDF